MSEASVINSTRLVTDRDDRSLSPVYHRQMYTDLSPASRIRALAALGFMLIPTMNRHWFLYKLQ